MGKKRATIVGVALLALLTACAPVQPMGLNLPGEWDFKLPDNSTLKVWVGFIRVENSFIYYNRGGHPDEGAEFIHAWNFP